MKKWLLSLLALVLVSTVAAGTAFALSQGETNRPSTEDNDRVVRSDEDIDPNKCNWVHNIHACDGAPPAVGPGEEDRVQGPARIEDAYIIIRESYPPQYAVHVKFGLPSGCALLGGYQVEKADSTIHVTVWVTTPADPNVMCTMIYGIGSYDIDLNEYVASGETYTILVNDHALELAVE